MLMDAAVFDDDHVTGFVIDALAVVDVETLARDDVEQGRIHMPVALTGAAWRDARDIGLD